MRLGIIWVGHQCADLLSRSLQPWITARAQQPGGHTFDICAVNVPFEGFDQPAIPDSTREVLTFAVAAGQIDHAITLDRPIRETEARGTALRWLVARGATHIVQVDSDELWTLDQIVRVFQFVESHPGPTWWRLSFKNRVFSPYQYLADPFTPPRIHRVIPFTKARLDACGFWDDNNVLYRIAHDGSEQKDTAFASVVIPRAVAFVEHWTWLDDFRSEAKVRYQLARGWQCSFAWVDGHLAFNEAYYQSHHLPLPEVLTD